MDIINVCYFFAVIVLLSTNLFFNHLIFHRIWNNICCFFVFTIQVLYFCISLNNLCKQNVYCRIICCCCCCYFTSSTSEYFSCSQSLLVQIIGKIWSRNNPHMKMIYTHRSLKNIYMRNIRNNNIYIYIYIFRQFIYCFERNVALFHYFI